MLANTKYTVDFPKKGVLFKDFSSVLAIPELIPELTDACTNHIHNNFDLSEKRIHYIVGLESRGFILGMMLANTLHAGFVMIRKKGKLTPPVISVDYEKEYGTDSFEIQTRAIKPNSRVLIVDDLLATGGSLESAVKLINNLEKNIEIVGCFTIMKVDSLANQAFARLKDVQVEVLL